METPTILYLNNRYVNSLEELKSYLGSKFNEVPKGELIAAFRDKVLYDWLNEGGETEKRIACNMLPILDQHLGNGEVLKKIAELFDVPNPLIADYKFVDHAEYLGCIVLSSDDEQTQHPTVPNAGVINIKKGVTKCRIVFKFKILAPENDYLSLQLDISPKIEKATSMDQAKLDLVGKKNEIRTIELGVDVEKLCKDCSLTLSHDNTIVGRVAINNHENTDKVIEAIEETIPEGYHKMDIAARVCKKQSLDINQDAHNQVSLRFGFYGIHGNQVLMPELRLLKNSMYPDLDFGFYYKKTQEQDKIKKSLYHISENGYKYLGDFIDANPLNDDLVAVRKTKDSKKCGIIDRNANIILQDNKVGQIYGINKDMCLVCEVRPNTQGLTDLKGNELGKDMKFERYYVNPNSNLICAYYYNHIYYTMIDDTVWSKDGKQEIPRLERINYLLLNNDYVFIYGYGNNDFKMYFTWFDIKKDKKLYYKHAGNQIQVWSKKPIFPIVNDGCSYSAPVSTKNGSREVFIKPVIVTDSWMINFDYNIPKWSIYQNKGSGFEEKDFFNNITSVFLVFGNFKKQKFIVQQSSNLVLSTLRTNNDELRYDHQNIPIKNGLDRIVSVVSCGNYITIAYMFKSNNGDNTQCSVIINQEGKVVFEDEWGDFPWVCGLINNQLYYLNNGELYCMNEDESNKKQLSNTLKANELYQLGTTNHFVVKYAKEYQIIDAKGQKLGKPFEDFDISISQGEEIQIMDYIYNSERLPIIRNGKHGLINTNGKDIVPCEYDKVEELNSVFKQQGIIVF